MNVPILKYDPASDAAPHYVAYEVPYKDLITVLEVITYVHENCEPVSFDYCQAACPVYAANSDSYAGPAAMLATAYRDIDPYGQGDRVLEAISLGLYRCIVCGKCNEVCPRV